MKDIYVVTHTQSHHHVEGLVGGWHDSSLTDHGRAQARLVAARLQATLKDVAPIEVYASDLLRAEETAAIIAAALGVAAQTTADLRERSLGEAGGKPQAWLAGRVIPPPKTGNRLDHRDGVPGAESKREFLTRIYRAMDRMIQSPCPTQVIVTHGFALTFVVAAWVKMPMEAAGYVNFRSSPGGLTHLREDDEFFNRSVMSLNDTSHLAGL
jgi:probable phosphoglycerate mutase